jgi:hypothetical protein
MAAFVCLEQRRMVLGDVRMFIIPNFPVPIMKLGQLRRILSKLANENANDVEIWLSCDEEGNEFLPMPANQDLSIDIDKNTMRIVFFPCHR